MHDCVRIIKKRNPPTPTPLVVPDLPLLSLHLLHVLLLTLHKIENSRNTNLKIQRVQYLPLHLHQVVLLVSVVSAEGEVLGADVADVFAFGGDEEAGCAD